MTGPCCPHQPVAVHAVSGLGLLFFFFSVLPPFEISAVRDGALCSCPVGGEEGGRVLGLLSAMGLLPFSSLITV